MSQALAIRDEKHYLETLSEIKAVLERITEVGEARDLAAKARAAEVWAKRAHLGREKETLAMLARRWAERRAGQLLAASRQNGARGGGRPRKELQAETLSDLGVTKIESHRWQKLAAIAPDDFENVCRAAVKASERDLKSAGRSARDAAIRAEREKAEAAARAYLAEAGADAKKLYVSKIKHWRPTGVSCIVTDPPYITSDAVELHRQLADFAVDVLPQHGALAVMTWQPLLPAVFEAMSRPNLVYRWTAAWTFGTNERTPERKPRVFDGWKPVLFFHKDGWTDETTYLYDVIVSRNTDKESHEWGQNVGGFRHLVRACSQPGETVCDPFLGGGTTAVAALAEARMFIGADENPAAVATTNARLA